jgi:hypothetical protein
MVCPAPLFSPAMVSHSLPLEIILSRSLQRLGQLHLNWDPQPGSYVEFEEQVYLVLERRHRYHLQFSHYCLHHIALYVQPLETPLERSQLNNRWVIGDASCRFNAGSEVLRCAVNPCGPCQHCIYYQPQSTNNKLPKNCA